MIHGVQVAIFLDHYEARPPLNDIGLVSYFSLLDNSLTGFHKSAFGYIQKNGTCSIFRKKSQKFLLYRRIPLLFLNYLVKITGRTRLSFFSKRALHLASAAGAGNRPANPAGIFPEVDPIERRLNGRRANTKFLSL